MKRFFIPFVTLSIVFVGVFCGCKTANTVQKPENPTSFKVDSPEMAQSSATSQTQQQSHEQTSGQTNPTESGDASRLISDAELALDQSAYSQSFRLAIQSYIANPSIEAESIATYAASMLPPRDQETLYQNATTHIERAILGKIRINGCIARMDIDCLKTFTQETSDALTALGKTDEASLIQGVYASASQSSPKIAILLPLSGGDRKIGRAMLGSVLMTQGIYHINYQYSGYPYPLVYFDTKSDAKSIPALMESLKDYPLIVGPIDIQESVAVSKHLQNNVMIGFSPNGNFIDSSSNSIQYSYSPKQEAKQIAEFCNMFQLKKIVAVGPEGTYFNNSVSELSSSISGNIKIDSVSYPNNQTDLRSYAKKVAGQKPDTIFLPESIDLAERTMSFMAQENIWCRDPRQETKSNISDGRTFVTCISTSIWSPISSNQYRFIQNAIYLDYSQTADEQAYASFIADFNSLYHRNPAVHEVLPFLTLHSIKNLTLEDFSSQNSLLSGIKREMDGATSYIKKDRDRQYYVIPSFLFITSEGPKPFLFVSKQ